MIKIILILICFPVIVFGQDLLSPFSSSELVVNHLLKKTIPFIKDKNSPKSNFRFYLDKQESLINWDDNRFYKWEVSKQRRYKLKK